jgi:hypothetical protein
MAVGMHRISKLIDLDRKRGEHLEKRKVERKYRNEIKRKEIHFIEAKDMPGN